MSSMFFGKSYDLHSQMSTCEQYALEQLLLDISPQVAIEVGTYQGGSLQRIVEYADEVTSIDIDQSVAERLKGKFPSVHFKAGDSSVVLAEVLSAYSAQNKHVEFILIDGDHSTEGVKKDIRAVLSWQPRSDCVVIMHDSFNPACRSGIIASSWETSPYVHAVEIDYIPGIYHEKAYDTALARSMWGGFACAFLKPSVRKDNLIIKRSQQGLFDAVYEVSSHRSKTISSKIFNHLFRKI